MRHLLDRSIPEVAAALRRRDLSAAELVEEAVRRHEALHERLHAYKHFDVHGARRAARAADERFAREDDPPPLCGIPFSVKDLYGVDGLPTCAGTTTALPEGPWSRDAWLVAALRDQGAVPMGKTHTVEMAYGGVGMNPHWETPRNPWDASAHRIPGGSSSGAGVSLHEGSALVALGTDTAGSIRIPASLTGVVGHKTTKGRWSTEGVFPLSPTFDTVGALTRTVVDAVWLFGAVDGSEGGPSELVSRLADLVGPGVRARVPEGAVWSTCQGDIASVLRDALEELAGTGWSLGKGDGALLDEAGSFYMTRGIPGFELKRFLDERLPGSMEMLHPVVGTRVARAADRSEEAYRGALRERDLLLGRVGALFGDADVLVLPTHLVTPPPVDALAELDRYAEVNARLLQATCPVSVLGLCAVTVPVGLDRDGLPVGLQIVARGGEDELALAASLHAERVLGSTGEGLGRPPRIART